MGRGRAPCCDKSKVKKGPWSPEEDLKLISFVHKHGHDNWRALPTLAGLLRCGKSCRLRWINYLRPDLKRGNFSPEEQETILKLHDAMGNKWSKIASHFPGRTDNEIKNVWNTHLKKRLIKRNGSLENATKSSPLISSTKSSTSSSSNSIISQGDHREGLGNQESMVTRESNSIVKPSCFNSPSSSYASNISSLAQVETIPKPSEDQELEIQFESDFEALWNMFDTSDDYKSGDYESQPNKYEVRDNFDWDIFLKDLKYELFGECDDVDVQQIDEDQEMVQKTVCNDVMFQPEIDVGIDCFAIWSPSSPQRFGIE